MLALKDIMTREVVSVRSDTPIYEAREIMRKNDITGVPFIDDDMALVGILTEKDVLRLFNADEDEKNKKVGYFMTRLAVSYRENESLENVCDFLMVNYFRRIPVVSKKGKVVGIISRPDIIDYIHEQRKQTIQVHSETNLASPAAQPIELPVCQGSFTILKAKDIMTRKVAYTKRYPCN